MNVIDGIIFVFFLSIRFNNSEILEEHFDFIPRSSRQEVPAAVISMPKRLPACVSLSMPAFLSVVHLYV